MSGAAVVSSGAAAAPPPAPAFPAAAINAAVQGKLGLVHVEIPGWHDPVWLRAGTNDAGDCVKFLAGRPGSLKIPYPPRRILEIGAGAGFRTLALARQFPDAEILATEANPACRAVNLLNTLPYRNIRFREAAVSDRPGRFEFAGRDGGPGNVVLQTGGGSQSVALAALLAGRGWEHCDTVIIKPDAASASLLTTAWPKPVRLVAVFTGGQPLSQAATERFTEAGFTTRLEGGYVLMLRVDAGAPATPAAPTPIFDTGGPPREFALVNVSRESWGYFPIGAHSFRLHPNRGGAPAARLVLSQECRGFRQLRAKVRVGNTISAPVQFAISVTAEPEGREIFSAQQVVNGGQEQMITGDVQDHAGPCRVVFATKMAANTAKNDCAWAEFLEPVFE